MKKILVIIIIVAVIIAGAVIYLSLIHIFSSIVNTTIKNRKIGMTILVVIISIASIYGLATKEPEHLYKGYSLSLIHIY